ncbi:exodeoxyribonuclease III [endosymbiont of Acanthamoeba sp. UWC8]|uniref:exodeoxyribonuclease III n=1 Tax=endosymbiont of Acanthamoeba sp. UWC8 TaxID=86106 RepID=UPI0004D1033C|nr:exodeoxyribonuclease III [endosymbiont of Acanthamoeba sp. UWC8]AIF81041.1 exodeoxyribonuclease III [endosymbiont of Acanthamoeba sp. UWC8]
MALIVSWNINSVKSRLLHLIKFIEANQPDVLLLQEIKCEKHNFPFLELEELGYNIAVHGQKSYNGVAILSKSPIEDIFIDLITEPDFKEHARYIECFTRVHGLNLRVASVYVPQGTEVDSERFAFKLRFYKALEKRYRQIMIQDEMLVAGGDYNVAPENMDVYDPKKLGGSLGFHLEERKSFRSLLNMGMKDSFRVLNPLSHEYSWWDYRSSGWQHNKGMRIDQILVSPNVANHLQSAGVYSEVRGWEKASDHAPIFCKLTNL